MMERPTKVHCLFEQSGAFKTAFATFGIPAEDYDIQNEYGQTDHVIELFAEIDEAYRGGQSVFDTFATTDLVMAFFPCIYFCEKIKWHFVGSCTNRRGSRHWKLRRKF